MKFSCKLAQNHRTHNPRELRLLESAAYTTKINLKFNAWKTLLNALSFPAGIVVAARV